METVIRRRDFQKVSRTLAAHSLPLNMFLNHSIFTALKSGRGIIELSLNAIKIVFIRGVQCLIKERWITDLTIIPRAVLM